MKIARIIFHIIYILNYSVGSNYIYYTALNFLIILLRAERESIDVNYYILGAHSLAPLCQFLDAATEEEAVRAAMKYLTIDISIEREREGLNSLWDDPLIPLPRGHKIVEYQRPCETCDSAYGESWRAYIYKQITTTTTKGFKNCVKSC